MQGFSDALDHALDRIGFAFTNEISLRIQFGIFLIVIILGLFLQISVSDFAIIMGISALVFSFELVNTAIEKSMDVISNGKYDERIKIIKDVSAGAVLIAAIFAIVESALIFIPKLMELFK